MKQKGPRLRAFSGYCLTNLPEEFFAHLPVVFGPVSIEIRDRFRIILKFCEHTNIIDELIALKPETVCVLLCTSLLLLLAKHADLGVQIVIKVFLSLIERSRRIEERIPTLNAMSHDRERLVVFRVDFPCLARCFSHTTHDIIRTC